MAHLSRWPVSHRQMGKDPGEARYPLEIGKEVTGTGIAGRGWRVVGNEAAQTSVNHGIALYRCCILICRPRKELKRS